MSKRVPESLTLLLPAQKKARNLRYSFSNTSPNISLSSCSRIPKHSQIYMRHTPSSATSLRKHPILDDYSTLCCTVRSSTTTSRTIVWQKLPSEAATLDHILRITWDCLSSTPSEQKHPIFNDIVSTYDDLQGLASLAPIVFAPNLLNIVQNATPPSLEFFKCLPVGNSKTKDTWGVYLLVMEKSDNLPRLYIGSGTEDLKGIRVRLLNYETRSGGLPRLVKKAFKEGFTITHKGILCRTALPSGALQSRLRVLMFTFESFLSYIFWTMSDNKRVNHKMSRICPWPLETLPYDGLCTHSALIEAVRGDHGLKDE